MRAMPYGALTTIGEAGKLLAKAKNEPITVFRIEADGFVIRKRIIDSEASIIQRGPYPLLQYRVWYEDNHRSTTGTLVLGSRSAFMFTNYWHAWAYLQSNLQGA